MKILNDMNELNEAYLIEMCHEVIKKGLHSKKHVRQAYTGKLLTGSKTGSKYISIRVEENLYQSMFMIDAKEDCLAYLLLNKCKASLSSQIFKAIIESFQNIKKAELESVSVLLYNLFASSLEELSPLSMSALNYALSSRFKLLQFCIKNAGYPYFDRQSMALSVHAIPVISKLDNTSIAVRVLAALRFSTNKAIAIQSNIVTKIAILLLTEKGIEELEQVENGTVVSIDRTKRVFELMNENEVVVKYTTRKKKTTTTTRSRTKKAMS